MDLIRHLRILIAVIRNKFRVHRTLDGTQKYWQKPDDGNNNPLQYVAKGNLENPKAIERIGANRAEAVSIINLAAAAKKIRGALAAWTELYQPEPTRCNRPTAKAALYSRIDRAYASLPRPLLECMNIAASRWRPAASSAGVGTSDHTPVWFSLESHRHSRRQGRDAELRHEKRPL